MAINIDRNERFQEARAQLIRAYASRKFQELGLRVSKRVLRNIKSYDEFVRALDKERSKRRIPWITRPKSEVTTSVSPQTISAAAAQDAPLRIHWFSCRRAPYWIFLITFLLVCSAYVLQVLPGFEQGSRNIKYGLAIFGIAITVSAMARAHGAGFLSGWGLIALPAVASPLIFVQNIPSNLALSVVIGLAIPAMLIGLLPNRG